MTSPDDEVEVCECGHESGDHCLDIPEPWINLLDWAKGFAVGGHSAAVTGFIKECEELVTLACDTYMCDCVDYKPRDAQYYADLAGEARLEKWESER